MKQKLLFFVLFFYVSLSFSQRFSSNTILPGTKVEFGIYGSSSKFVSIYTPTLYQSFDIKDYNSIGYSYFIEVYNSSKKLVSRRKVSPKDYSSKISGGWYQYKVIVPVSKTTTNYVKVLLYKERYIKLNFGGHSQPPRLYGQLISQAEKKHKSGNTGGDNSKPNLTIPRVSITNGNGQHFNPLLNEVPILRRNQWFKVNFDVKNTGGSSKPTDATVLVGSSSNIGSATVFARLPVSALSKNNSVTRSKNQHITSSDILGSFKLSPGREYYLFVQVDETNINKESNENDNIKKFKFKYYSSGGKNPIAVSKTSPYKIDIYDFSGQRILSKTVQGIEDENALINELPKDLYIIKSKHGDRKVFNER